jgi:uncharacterized membrane protein
MQAKAEPQSRRTPFADHHASQDRADGQTIDVDHCYPSPDRDDLGLVSSKVILIHFAGDAAMSDLIVIVYPSEARAEEVRKRLFDMQKEYLIELGDAVVAEKMPDGHVKLHQLFNTTAVGAASGSFWGLLIGVLFLNPLIGVALGAASGALAGSFSDYGIEDKFMKELSDSLQPGNAALSVLIRKMTTDKVLDHLKGTGGTVLRTSLDHTNEQALRDALAAATSAAPAIADKPAS